VSMKTLGLIALSIGLGAASLARADAPVTPMTLGSVDAVFAFWWPGQSAGASAYKALKESLLGKDDRAREAATQTPAYRDGLPRSAGCSNRHRETGRFEPARISCRGPASKPSTVIDQVSAMTVTRRAAMTVTRRVRPDSFGSRTLLTGPRKLTHCDHRYQVYGPAGTAARSLADTVVIKSGITTRC